MDFPLCPFIKKKDFQVPSHVYYSHMYAVIVLLLKKSAAGCRRKVFTVNLLHRFLLQTL